MQDEKYCPGFLENGRYIHFFVLSVEYVWKFCYNIL